MVDYLSVRQYLHFKRLQEMLNDIFAVQISEGVLHCLLKRLAYKGVDAYEIMRQKCIEQWSYWHRRNGCENQREKTLDAKTLPS